MELIGLAASLLVIFFIGVNILCLTQHARRETYFEIQAMSCPPRLTVIPAKAGIHQLRGKLQRASTNVSRLDSRLRGNDSYANLDTSNDLRILEAVFISYALGVGAISLEMLLFCLAGLKFYIPALIAPWVIILLINICRYRRHGFVIARTKPEARPPDTDSRAVGQAISFLGLLRQPMSMMRLPRNDGRVLALDVFLAFGISLETFYAFFRALIKPIESYDAVAIYAIKSKIFYLAKSIPENYFPGLVHSFPHPDYPLNIPLAETFMYIFMRGLNDQLVKVIFPLFFVGILALLYCAIRRFASRTYALCFTFILATIPMFNAYAANAYQEVPLAFYCFASLLFLLKWIENKQDLRSLAISAIMAAFAAWTKNEGLMYCVINTSLALIISTAVRKGATARTIYAPILYIAIVGIILAPWIWVKYRFHIVNDEINLLNVNPVYLSKQLHRLGPIFYELQKQLFGPKKWILLWPAAIIAIVLNHRKIFTGTRKYISISIILAFCGYITMYMISYVDAAFFASKTWARFMLDFLPMLVLMLAYMFKEDAKLC